jgi:hypothetical protein
MESTVKGIVTIDVEPDNVWSNTQSRTLENLKCLPRFHHLCQEHGIRPTYLVTWSVASDSACASILESLLSHGDCEVGIHPHLWETPAILPKDEGSHAWVGSDYPLEVLESKLTNLTTLIKTRFGAPISHRAGRWGMDSRQVDLLLRLGIEIDSSVTPGLDWSTTGAPDYSKAPLTAYQLDADNIVEQGNSRLIEVPCTIRPGWRINGWEKRRYIRSAWRVLGLNPQWLRVSPASSAASLENVCDWACKRLPHLNLMSHSSEFMAGGSPYWRTEEEVARHFDIYNSIFTWWRNHSIEPKTLSEFSVFYRTKMVKQ